MKEEQKKTPVTPFQGVTIAIMYIAGTFLMLFGMGILFVMYTLLIGG